MTSELEQAFITRYKQLGAGYDLIEEHRFHETRKWRFDYAHISSKTAIELEGGVYNRGRHTRGKGFENDCEKYNAAVVDGWVILRYTSNMLDSDPANVIEQIDSVIAMREPDMVNLSAYVNTYMPDLPEGNDLPEPGAPLLVEPQPAEPITIAADIPDDDIEDLKKLIKMVTTKPEVKLLPPRTITKIHPYNAGQSVYINATATHRRHGARAYPIVATGWLSGRATVTLNIGTGDAINWTVFADRVSIESPFIKKATEDIAA